MRSGKHRALNEWPLTNFLLGCRRIPQPQPHSFLFGLRLRRLNFGLAFGSHVAVLTMAGTFVWGSPLISGRFLLLGPIFLHENRRRANHARANKERCWDGPGYGWLMEPQRFPLGHGPCPECPAT